MLSYLPISYVFPIKYLLKTMNFKPNCLNLQLSLALKNYKRLNTQQETPNLVSKIYNFSYQKIISSITYTSYRLLKSTIKECSSFNNYFTTESNILKIFRNNYMQNEFFSKLLLRKLWQQMRNEE